MTRLAALSLAALVPVAGLVAQDSRPATRKPAAKPISVERAKLVVAKYFLRGEKEGMGEALAALQKTGGGLEAFVGQLHERVTKLALRLAEVKGAPSEADDEAVKQAALAELEFALTSKDARPADAFVGRGVIARDVLRDFNTKLRGFRKEMIARAVYQGISSGAIYANQYSGLAGLGNDVVSLLFEHIESPPPGRRDAFLQAYLAALRDVTTKLDKEQLERIAEFADDEFETEQIRSRATFVLAFFGDTKRLDARRVELEALTQKEGRPQRVRAWQGLANLHYEMRAYAKAAESYKELLGLIEDMPGANLATNRYNMACSLALAGKLDEAFTALDAALDEGGENLSDSLLRSDHDISALRKDSRFAELMKKHDRLQDEAKAPKKEPGSSAGK